MVTLFVIWIIAVFVSAYYYVQKPDSEKGPALIIFWILFSIGGACVFIGLLLAFIVFIRWLVKRKVVFISVSISALILSISFLLLTMYILGSHKMDKESRESVSKPESKEVTSTVESRKSVSKTEEVGQSAKEVISKKWGRP